MKSQEIYYGCYNFMNLNSSNKPRAVHRLLHLSWSALAGEAVALSLP